MTAAMPVWGVITPRVIVVPSKPGAVAGALPSPPATVVSLDESSLPLPPQAAASSESAASGTSSLAHLDRRITSVPPKGVVWWSVGERPGLEVRLDAQPH